MSHVLSFPAYLPNSRELKANLLLHERTSTIVPRVDQDEVLKREHIAKILGSLPPDAFGFFDPTSTYIDWFSRKKVVNNINNKIRSIVRGDGYKDLCNAFEIDGLGYFKPVGDYSAAYKRLVDKGWRPLALKKFPPDLLDQLIDLKLAARVPAFKGEHEPVLTHPTIGGFILSQLARHFASCSRVVPLANTDNSFKDCLFDGTLTGKQQRSLLLGITINAAVPSDIDSVDGDEFASLRSALAATRNKLSNLLQDLLINLNLDSERDAIRFKEQISDRVADIHERIVQAERYIGPRMLVNRTLTLAVSALGGAAGFALGGLPGALIGSLSPSVMANVPGNLSTQFYPKGHGSIEEFAAIRAKVIRAGERARYQRFVPYV